MCISAKGLYIYKLFLSFFSINLFWINAPVFVVCLFGFFFGGGDNSVLCMSNVTHCNWKTITTYKWLFHFCENLLCAKPLNKHLYYHFFVGNMWSSPSQADRYIGFLCEVKHIIRRKKNITINTPILCTFFFCKKKH